MIWLSTHVEITTSFPSGREAAMAAADVSGRERNTALLGGRALQASSRGRAPLTSIGARSRSRLCTGGGCRA
jgi:hypothetical protein